MHDQKPEIDSRCLQPFMLAVPFAAAMLDRDMRYLAVTRRWLEILRLSGQNIIGRSHYDLFPQKGDNWTTIYSRCLAGAHQRFEEAIHREDGAVEWLKWEVVPWYDNEDRVGGIIISAEDISDRKKAEDAARESESHFRTLFEFAPDGVVIVNDRHEIITVNDQTRQLTGYLKGELIHQAIEKLVPEEYAHAHVRWRNEYERGQRPNAHKRGESSGVLCRRKDGTAFPAEISVRPFSSDRGLIVFCIIRDITEQRKLEDRLRRMSKTDSLTGLANRRSFDETIGLEWRRALRTPTPLALIMIDIDRFKELNDTYGHLAGDECLKKIGEVLKKAARRAGNLAARYGGDEFILLLPLTNADEARKTAEEIRTAVEMIKIAPGGRRRSVLISVSIGIASLVPRHGTSVEGLIAAADQALYRAKQTGRNRIESAA